MKLVLHPRIPSEIAFNFWKGSKTKRQRMKGKCLSEKTYLNICAASELLKKKTKQYLGHSKFYSKKSIIQVNGFDFTD